MADPTKLIRIEPTPKGLFVLASALVVAWVFLHLLPVLLVVVVAMFIVGTLNPAVGWLERKQWSRGRAIALVFALALVATLLVLAFTIPALVDQVASLIEMEPAARSHVVAALKRSPLTATLADSIRDLHYGALARSSVGTAFAYSSRVVETFAYLASSVFLALYIMIDNARLRGGLFTMVPRNFHLRLSRVLMNLETIVGGYIRGQALTSLFMTGFVFALLLACGVKNALAIAVFAGLADILPYIGVFLAVGPALAAALPRGPGIVLIVLVAMLAYEEVESRFIVPRIYGSALRLPSSVILFALLAGGTLMGITGALLALPTAAAIKMLIEQLRVELPGEAVDDGLLRARDERAEKEYERRAEGVPAIEASAIAVEISEGRREEEGGDEKAAEVPLTSGKIKD